MDCYPSTRSFRAQITILIWDGICLTRIMKYTDMFCNSQKWKYEIFIIFVNLQMNPINGSIFEQVSKKSVYPKFWRQIIVHFCVHVNDIRYLSSLRNVSLVEAKQRHSPPVCCCSVSLKQMEIHSMTMELEFSNLYFVEISLYEYDAYMSWNMAEYIKWYQTKIWADRATLDLSNGVLRSFMRHIVCSKCLSES